MTAKTAAPVTGRVAQCDIFRDIVLVESVDVAGDQMTLSQIKFPFAMCINQGCDLESDIRDREKPQAANSDKALLHLIMLPVFDAEKVLMGTHWGDLYASIPDLGQKRDYVCQNEVPRYHYLRFPEAEKIGPFIVDFKHFFTVSRDYLYRNIGNRVCSLADLFRESVSTRFANYLARIGLP